MIPNHIRQEIIARFGNLEEVSFKTITYYCRPITINEYKYVVSSLAETASDTDLEDLVFRIGVVYPENIDIDRTLAGHITSVADVILRISGLTDLGYLVSTLEKYRSEVEESIYMMKAFIMATMPAYTEEDLDQYTVELLIKKVALAEKITMVQQATLGLPPEAAFAFAFGSTEPEEEVFVEQKRQPINKDKLLSKIAQAEYETSGNPYAKETLKEFDEDTLSAMTGTPKMKDPIAEKLRRSLM